jgi:hypothetical protein
VIETVCGTGDDPLKLRVALDSLIIGLARAGPTLRVTLIVRGPLLAFLEFTATLAV